MTLRAMDIVNRWAAGELVDLWLRRSDGSPILVKAAECRTEPHMNAGKNDVLILGACEEGRLFASNTNRDEFGDKYLFDLSVTYADAIRHYLAKNRRCIYWSNAVSQLLRPRDEVLLLDDKKQPREYKVVKKSCVWYCKSRLVGKRNYGWQDMPWFDARGEYLVNPCTEVTVGPPPYKRMGI